MRRRTMTVGLFLLMLGVLPLSNGLNNPRIQALRGPDVLQLVAAGMCFGAGLMLLTQEHRLRGERTESKPSARSST